MKFRFVSTVPDLLFRVDGVIVLTVDGPHDIQLHFRPPTAVEITRGCKELKTFCIASGSWNLSEKIQGIFASLEQRMMSPGWLREEGWESQVEDDGRFKENISPRGELFPPAFQDFARSVYDELLESCERAVAVMRWRYAATGSHRKVAQVEFEWSEDGGIWKQMPYTGQWYAEVSQGVYPDARTADTIDLMLRQQRREPVGHELFREAWSNRFSNPRSSLLIGVAAAEVGFKECVAELIPGAAWLVEYAPSPPLVIMLTDYLPKLPTKCIIDGKVVPPPKAVIDTLKEGGSTSEQSDPYGSRPATLRYSGGGFVGGT